MGLVGCMIPGVIGLCFHQSVPRGWEQLSGVESHRLEFPVYMFTDVVRHSTYARPESSTV